MNINLLSKNKTYVLALSLGMDSYALFEMLIEAKIDFVIAHVNYHVRVDADIAAEAIRKLGEKYRIKTYILDSNYQKGNFEDYARNVRYNFFKKLIDKYHYDAVLTAHNKDDLIETYYLQMKRGFVSYYGLKEVTYLKGIKVIRPLLNYRKKELKEYCLKNHLDYIDDYTNYDTKYQRNALRKQLKDLDDQKTEEIILEINHKNVLLNKETNKLTSMIQKNKISLLSFNLLIDKEKIRLLFIYLKNVIKDYLLPTSFGKDIIEKINKPGNISIFLNNEYELIKDYQCLKIVKKRTYNYCLEIDSPSIIDNEFIYLDLKNEDLFFIKKDSYPLFITNVKGHEVIKIGAIHKKISRVFIDNRIPLDKRRYWPIIYDCHQRIIFTPLKEKDDKGRFIVKDICL